MVVQVNIKNPNGLKKGDVFVYNGDSKQKESEFVRLSLTDYMQEIENRLQASEKKCASLLKKIEERDKKFIDLFKGGNL